MQEDTFPAAERILADIENVFKRDPKLKEFDIIPVTVNHNKSPLHHVEHCLALESWCVRHVYCYAYHRLLDTRHFRHRRADPEVTSRLLLGALLLNPDVSTFWNMRKELVQSGRLDVQSELHFSVVILSRKPKSAEAFSYRRYLLEKLLTTGADKIHLLEEELQVCAVAADRYPGNYHAWQHRTWSMVRLADTDQLWLKEWQWSEGWMSLHISDYSGLHYRQFLLRHLLGDGNAGIAACTEIITSELESSTDLITRYPSHEALWNYRRSVLTCAKEYLPKFDSYSNAAVLTASVNGKCVPENGFECGTVFKPEEFWKRIVQQERHFVDRCKMTDKQFVLRHLHWMLKALGVNLEEG
ncbi:protein prenyltransferase alpha subunit repeat-containing protein 1 isoform X1 [Schistocerca nitens]|uniref:protein prenyltransferase alpha subunit repeat-containing protein 1 isoform X1 n=1 Tax=Schistocerca nitens TaxID=7011 RepID=UPI002118584E|nr:protein prenyltransferase alpha subunit repeat-containing protein 1 isoform X1 [Schistocerca nitens]